MICSARNITMFGDVVGFCYHLCLAGSPYVLAADGFPFVARRGFFLFIAAFIVFWLDFVCFSIPRDVDLVKNAHG